MSPFVVYFLFIVYVVVSGWLIWDLLSENDSIRKKKKNVLYHAVNLKIVKGKK